MDISDPDILRMYRSCVAAGVLSKGTVAPEHLEGTYDVCTRSDELTQPHNDNSSNSNEDDDNDVLIDDFIYSSPSFSRG